jgi:hypothetical protein
MSTPVAGAILAFAALAAALRVALVLRPIEAVDRLFVPDDTYYTLTISRSLAEGRGPTADGSTATSGFQPLLGFLQVPVHWVIDSLDAVLRVNLLLLVVADVVVVLALAWLAWRLAGPVAGVLAAGLWAVSPVGVSMAVGGLETSLAMAVGLALVVAWIVADGRVEPEGRARWWVVVGVLAGLAPLARIDLLALVGLLALIQVVRGPARSLRIVAPVAAAVVAPWWLYCLATLGTPVPTSGAAVHDLAPFDPYSREVLGLEAGAVAGGPFGVWDDLRARIIDRWVLGQVLFVVLVGLGLAVAVWWWRRSDRAFGLGAALPGFAVVLLVFYGWFGVSWYFTRYLAPVAAVATLVLSVVLARLWAASRSAPGRARAFARAGLLGLGAVVVVGTVNAVRTDLHWLQADERGVAVEGPATFDATTGFRASALAILHTIPRGTVVGGWQSGALGYYGGTDRTVVNLDGAVNPDVAGLEPAELAAYLRDRRIEWFADSVLVEPVVTAVVGALEPPPRVEPGPVVRPGGGSPEYTAVRFVWR